MKLTIKQLKQLIKEQVNDFEEDPERDHRLEKERISRDMEDRRQSGFGTEKHEDKIMLKTLIDSLIDKALDAGKLGGMRNAPEEARRVVELRTKILGMFGEK